MKLKYYMRGLGTGILFSVVVMGLTGANEKTSMSDTEIIHAAKALGMVESESHSNYLGLSPTIGPEATTGSGVDTTIQTSITPEPTEKPTEKPTITPTPTKKPKPTPTIKLTPTPTIKLTPTPKPTTKPDTKKETITLNIVKGMYSYTVAKEAYRVGLIDDIDEFDDYLVENGYASNIRINTYEFEKGASMSEIAKKITTR